MLAAWGVPDLTGKGRFVTANLIDSLGNGLVMAFTIVYFARTTSLSLVEVGAALTLGRLLTLPAPPLIGPVLDRIGPQAMIAVGNAISVVGFVGYLFSHSVWQIVVSQVVVQFGANCYWLAASPLTVLAARGGERTRWFGLVRALRNIGIGFGGVASAVALSIGTTTGLRAVMVVNAVTFAIAGWLVLSWDPPPEPMDGADQTPRARSDAGTARGSYLTVLRDTRYLTLVAVNVAFVFAAMVVSVLLAIYTADSLGVGAWVVGVLVALNTAMVALLQTVASRWIETRRPIRVIAVASLLNALACLLFAALVAVPGWAVIAGLLVAMVVYTVAEILSSPPVSELSVIMAPEHLRGRYLAVFQLSWSIGGALAPVLLTALLDGGAVLPWVFLAVLSLLAVPATLSIDARAPAQAPPSPGPAPTTELNTDAR